MDPSSSEAQAGAISGETFTFACKEGYLPSGPVKCLGDQGWNVEEAFCGSKSEKMLIFG